MVPAVAISFSKISIEAGPISIPSLSAGNAAAFGILGGHLGGGIVSEFRGHSGIEREEEFHAFGFGVFQDIESEFELRLPRTRLITHLVGLRALRKV